MSSLETDVDVGSGLSWESLGDTALSPQPPTSSPASSVVSTSSVLYPEYPYCLASPLDFFTFASQRLNSSEGSLRSRIPTQSIPRCPWTMSVAPSSPPFPSAHSTPIKDKNASATTTNGAPPTPTHKPFLESENVPPTPEVRLNGQRTSTSSLRGGAATPSRDGQGGGDGWGSKFWVTLVDPQVRLRSTS